jgi:hypothetical protein
VTSSGLTKVELFAVLRGCLVSVGARQEESAAPAMRGAKGTAVRSWGVGGPLVPLRRYGSMIPMTRDYHWTKGQHWGAASTCYIAPLAIPVV